MVNPSSSSRTCLLIFFLISFQSLVLSQGLIRTEENASLVLQDLLHTPSSKPRHIKYASDGFFYVSNLDYPQDLLVFNHAHKFSKRIDLASSLSFFGHTFYDGVAIPAPGKMAFSHNSKYLWLTYTPLQAQKLHKGISNICDQAFSKYPSYIYRIETETSMVQAIIPTGKLPSDLIVVPDSPFLLVVNKCSQDISIISTETNEEIRRILLRGQPSHIVLDPSSKYAFVSLQTGKIAVIRLSDFSVSYLEELDAIPRNLLIDSTGKFLFITFPTEGKVAKMDLNTGEIIKRIHTGKSPGEMIFSPNQQYIYVVNEYSHNFCKVRAADLSIISVGATNFFPRTIDYDHVYHQLWVGSDTGNIMIWNDMFVGNDSTVEIPQANKPSTPVLPYMKMFKKGYQSDEISQTQSTHQVAVSQDGEPTSKLIETFGSSAQPEGIKMTTEEMATTSFSHPDMIYLDKRKPQNMKEDDGYSSLNADMLSNSAPRENSTYPQDNVSQKPINISQNPQTRNPTNTSFSNYSPTDDSSNSLTETQANNSSVSQNDVVLKPVSSEEVDVSNSTQEKPEMNYAPQMDDLPPVPPKKYYLVLGSFTTKTNAESRKKELSNTGLLLDVISHQETNYRILSQGFTDIELAKNEVDRLKNNLNIQSWIWKR